MEENSPRIRSLLRQAASVAESGKRAAALKLYRQIIDEAPETAEGWLGLADLTRNEGERRKAYGQVLALEPDNREARQGLAALTDDGQPGSDLDAAPAFDLARDWLDEQTARQRFDILDGPRKEVPAAKPPPVVEPITEPTAVDPALHTAVTETDSALFCYRHPKRETNLRCISCERPICGQCAQHTPVGYRCPTCIREAQAVFYSATPVDYVLATLVSLPLSLIAGFLVAQFGRGFFFIFLMIFIGGGIGRFIGRVAHRAAGRRRGRYLPYIVAGTIVLGALLPLLGILQIVLAGGVGALTLFLVPGIYLFVATSAAFYSMR